MMTLIQAHSVRSLILPELEANSVGGTGAGIFKCVSDERPEELRASDNFKAWKEEIYPESDNSPILMLLGMSLSLRDPSRILATFDLSLNRHFVFVSKCWVARSMYSSVP